MIWFGRNALAAAIYAPAALAGLLLPYAAFPAAAARVDAAVLGVALCRALEAAALTYLGAKCGYAFAVWGAAGALSLLAPARVSGVPSLLPSGAEECMCAGTLLSPPVGNAECIDQNACWYFA